MAPCRPARLAAAAAAAAAVAALAAAAAVVGAPRGGAAGGSLLAAASAAAVGGGGGGGNPWLAAIRPHLPSVRLAAAAAAAAAAVGRQDAGDETDSEDRGGGNAAAAASPPASRPGLTCQTYAEVQASVDEAAASLRADDEAPPGAAAEFAATVLAAYPSFVVDVVGDRSCVKTGAFGDFLIDTLVDVLDADSDDDDDEQH